MVYCRFNISWIRKTVFEFKNIFFLFLKCNLSIQPVFNLKSDFLRSCSLYGFSLIKGSSSSVSANSILRRSGNFFPKNSFSLVVFLSRANFFRVRFVKFDAFAVVISLRFLNLCVPLINQTNGIVGDTRLSVPIQIQKPIVQT